MQVRFLSGIPNLQHMIEPLFVPFETAPPKLKKGFDKQNAHFLAVLPDELDHPEKQPKWMVHIRTNPHGFSVKFCSQHNYAVYVTYTK